MDGYMDGRYTIFHHLLTMPEEGRGLLIESLREYNEEGWIEFSNWCRRTIKIGEEDLGQTFPDNFKELF